MFKSLLIYEFKFSTKNGKNVPEKPSPVKDKFYGRFGRAATLIVWAGPLIIKGPGHAPKQYFFPFKYWLRSSIFSHLLHYKLSDLNLLYHSLKPFDHIIISFCFQVIQASTFQVQEKNPSILQDKKYFNLL